MDIEELLERLNTLLLERKQRVLEFKEEEIIRKSWEDKTYDEITIYHYKPNYIKKNLAPKLWELLSEVTGKKVTKKNMKGVLPKALEERSLHPTTPSQPPSPLNNSCKDWGEAPDVSIFYDRSDERTTLQQWILEENCRAVEICGMGGIGKTALATTVAREIADRFEFVIWRSLRYSPPLPELLNDLLQALVRPSDIEEINPQSQLIYNLKHHRCLLILDEWETVFSNDKLAGYYREDCEDYGDLLKRIAEVSHQSCLIITTRERPRDSALFVAKPSPYRLLELKSLPELAVQKLLENTGLSATELELTKLVEQYAGNPLTLKIISSTIQDSFGGNVDEFLCQSTLFVGDRLNYCLNQQFERLELREKEILYLLAIENKPVSKKQLKSEILPQPSSEEIVNYFQSLLRRSLLEKTTANSEVLYFLQPVVRKFIKERLIKQISEDIWAFFELKQPEYLGLLKTLMLVKNPENYLLGKRVKDRLNRLLPTGITIEQIFEEILLALEELPESSLGYAKVNIINLRETNAGEA